MSNQIMESLRQRILTAIQEGKMHYDQSGAPLIHPDTIIQKLLSGEGITVISPPDSSQPSIILSQPKLERIDEYDFKVPMNSLAIVDKVLYVGRFSRKII